MKKGAFYIRMNRLWDFDDYRYVKIDGFTQDFKAPDGSTVSVGFEKREGGEWQGVELSTGFRLPITGETPEKAAKELRPEVLQEIADIMRKAAMQKLQRTLAEYTREHPI